METFCAFYTPKTTQNIKSKQHKESRTLQLRACMFVKWQITKGTFQLGESLPQKGTIAPRGKFEN